MNNQIDKQANSEQASTFSGGKKLWYKTPAGITFLVILFLILGLGLIFMTLVGYYLWQIKYSSAEVSTRLAQSFTNNEFTVDSSKTNQAGSAANLDPTNYVKFHNPTAGNTNADTTLVMFIDFECPFCQRAYPGFKNLMEKYGPALKIVFKHFPLESIHPNSMSAAVASNCASEQQSFWPYYDELFENKKFDRESLLLYASNLNLNIEQFENCIKEKRNKKNINEDLQDGFAMGVRGTPTYFLNDTKVEGVTDLETWETIIIDNLQEAK